MCGNRPMSDMSHLNFSFILFFLSHTHIPRNQIFTRLSYFCCNTSICHFCQLWTATKLQVVALPKQQPKKVINCTIEATHHLHPVAPRPLPASCQPHLRPQRLSLSGAIVIVHSHCPQPPSAVAVRCCHHHRRRWHCRHHRPQ